MLGKVTASWLFVAEAIHEVEGDDAFERFRVFLRFEAVPVDDWTVQGKDIVTGEAGNDLAQRLVGTFCLFASYLQHIFIEIEGYAFGEHVVHVVLLMADHTRVRSLMAGEAIAVVITRLSKVTNAALCDVASASR